MGICFTVYAELLLTPKPRVPCAKSCSAATATWTSAAMSARCTPARADRRLVQLDYLAPAVERVHPREDLVLGHLTPHLEEGENVDVVRHAAIGKDLHAGEELDAHQKVDEPVLLLVVEEERLVRNP